MLQFTGRLFRESDLQINKVVNIYIFLNIFFILNLSTAANKCDSWVPSCGDDGRRSCDVPQPDEEKKNCRESEKR